MERGKCLTHGMSFISVSYYWAICQTSLDLCFLTCTMGTNSTVHLKGTLEQSLSQVKFSTQLANIIKI